MRIYTKQARSLVSALHRATLIDKVLLKQEYKDGDGEAVLFACVNNWLDRRVKFYPIQINTKSGQWWEMFAEDTYKSVVGRAFQLSSYEPQMDFNTILAIHNEHDDLTWFGFSAEHCVVSINPAPNLKVSPNLPYALPY